MDDNCERICPGDIGVENQQLSLFVFTRAFFFFVNFILIDISFKNPFPPLRVKIAYSSRHSDLLIR